ncbi:MAG TPA: aminopeptidase N, partial [Rubrivivax sp.]
MESLKHAMKWDEDTYGLEVDLDEYNIVAVGDFNAGAMENKGLNIFNTACVLASPATATDADFAGIESVVGHEYFHNWTGNRITCRDWFQLSLKEGLTVFRDQEFSMDMAAEPSARAAKRIEDVRSLRALQFPEDAGPMAHPVRPDQYAAIDNFYTPTIYEKGAEVVRMMHTLVGREGFRRGMDLYFERHDGQAVTCDDFAQALADANPRSLLNAKLVPFKRWYAQAGTPRVTARGHYDAAALTWTLTLAQSTRATAGQPVKEPFVIPVRVGLHARDGSALALHLAGSDTPLAAEQLLVLDQGEQRWVFTGIDSDPVPSLLRGFSAPVLLDDGLSEADLLVLLQHDSDAFNRWEAGQRVLLQRMLGALDSGNEPVLDDALAAALRGVLRHPTLAPALKELVLTLPSEGYVAQQLEEADPQRIHTVRESLLLQVATTLQADWAWAFEAHQSSGGYDPSAHQAGPRALAGLALTMLCLAAARSGDTVWPGRAYQRVKDAANMTDRMHALRALVNSHAALAGAALERYYTMFKHEPLALDQWFALQARAPDPLGSSDGPGFARTQALMRHPDFTLRNPNRARSLVFSLCMHNPAAFHRADGAGYVFWAERVIELDAINPQIAARLARALDRWRQLAEPQRSAAREAISRVAARPELSPDTREIVGKALEAGA